MQLPGVVLKFCALRSGFSGSILRIVYLHPPPTTDGAAGQLARLQIINDGDWILGNTTQRGHLDQAGDIHGTVLPHSGIPARMGTGALSVWQS